MAENKKPHPGTQSELGDKWTEQIKKWNGPPPPDKYAHTYPRYSFTNFPDGSSVKHNWTEGNQYFQIQSREGDTLRSIPGGGLHMIAQKGLVNEVKGPIRTISTGGQDTTARGTIGIRASGENGSIAITADGKGGLQTTVKEDMTTSAKNSYIKVAEKMHTEGQESTTIMKNAISMNSSEGSLCLTAAKGTSLKSTQESVSIQGELSATMEGKQRVAITAGLETHMRTGGADILMSDGYIFLNCNMAQTAKIIYAATKSSRIIPESESTTIGV